MIDRDPLVTVVIPTYNRGHLIGDSVSSVLDQSFEDLELIVVDDGSTDDTEERIRAWRERDRRLVYLRNTRKKGAAGARNCGIGHARGKYVALLDSDDRWRPRKLERQVPILERSPNIGVVYAGWQWVNQETGSVRVARTPDANGRIDGLPRWFFNLSQDIVGRRDIIQGVPFDEGLRTYLDLDWLIRLSQSARFESFGEILVDCQDHTGPRNSDGGLARVEVLERVFAAHSDYIRTDPPAWRELNRKLGAGLLTLQGDRLRAKSYLYEAIRAGSVSGKTLSYGLIATLPGGERLLPALQERLAQDA